MTDWNDTQPIFIQIRQRIVELILSGAVGEGDALPSIRTVAADLAVNPLTVTRAYQALADRGVIEKRRGLGMFVAKDAREALLEAERQAFLTTEWPQIRNRIKALGLKPDSLLEDDTE